MGSAIRPWNVSDIERLEPVTATVILSARRGRLTTNNLPIPPVKCIPPSGVHVPEYTVSMEADDVFARRISSSNGE
nr:hypothetical protein [uncultured bacterium]